MAAVATAVIVVVVVVFHKKDSDGETCTESIDWYFNVAAVATAVLLWLLLLSSTRKTQVEKHVWKALTGILQAVGYLSQLLLISLADQPDEFSSLPQKVSVFVSHLCSDY